MKKKLINVLLYFILPAIVIFILFTRGILFGFAGILLYLGVDFYLLRPKIYQYIGSVKYSSGMLEDALKWFEKAYRTGKAGPLTLTSYGYLLLKAGKLSEADSVLKKVLEQKLNIDQKNYAEANMALVQWKKGNLDTAIEMLEKIIKNYKNTTMYGSLGCLYIIKGDLEKAYTFNQEAYEFNNSNTVIIDNLGQTHLLAGDYEKAEELYINLMEKKPAFPEAYYNYSFVLENKGEHEKALEMAKKALDYKVSFLGMVSREDLEKRVRQLEDSQKPTVVD